MLKRLLGRLWRGTPGRLRRWGVHALEAHFTVTAAAVIVDSAGRVLLLNHVFRAGSGWGIPGGFIGKGEQPEDALRRELREEIGLEVEDLQLAFARTLRPINQVEIVFRCRAAGEMKPISFEISRAEWFSLDELPRGLSGDQRRLIERALNAGGHRY